MSQVVMCVCGHDAVMHPADPDYPFRWPCTECGCGEWRLEYIKDCPCTDGDHSLCEGCMAENAKYWTAEHFPEHCDHCGPERKSD